MTRAKAGVFTGGVLNALVYESVLRVLAPLEAWQEAEAFVKVGKGGGVGGWGEGEGGGRVGGTLFMHNFFSCIPVTVAPLMNPLFFLHLAVFFTCFILFCFALVLVAQTRAWVAGSPFPPRPSPPPPYLLP